MFDYILNSDKNCFKAIYFCWLSIEFHLNIGLISPLIESVFPNLFELLLISSITENKNSQLFSYNVFFVPTKMII